MEEKDANIWWDVVDDIVQKDVGKVCRMYEKNEFFYKHDIFHMEKVIPLFQYELIVLTQEPETLDEEKKKGHIDDVKPLEIRTTKQELTNLKGGTDSSQKETGGMKYVSKHNLEPLEFVPQ